MTDTKYNTPALPKDTNSALREVIKTVANINDIYQEETEALIAIDSQKFLSLQEKKLDRASAYHAHMTQMIARKDEIKIADPTLRSKLKDLQKTFHDLSARNLEALDRMQRCTERLANTVRNAAVRAAQSQRNFSYGINGTLNNSTRNKVISTGLSETV